MASLEQKRRLLKAKIAVALYDEPGRVPKQEEIEQVFLLTRVMYKAVLGALPAKGAEEERTAGDLLMLIYARWLRPRLHP